MPLLFTQHFQSLNLHVAAILVHCSVPEVVTHSAAQSLLAACIRLPWVARVLLTCTCPVLLHHAATHCSMTHGHAGSTVNGIGPSDLVRGVESQLVMGMQLARSKVSKSSTHGSPWGQ